MPAERERAPMMAATDSGMFEVVLMSAVHLPWTSSTSAFIDRNSKNETVSGMIDLGRISPNC